MKTLLITIFLTCALAQDDYLFAWNDECGLASVQDFNIIGGQEADPNAYPWTISIQGIFPDSHFCGGSIISPNWVLTAAHCVDSSSPNSLTVAAGEHDFGDNDEATYVDVVDVIVHPDWAPFTSNNDIALLELAESLTFDDKITAVCAPNPNEDYTGFDSIVAGWGNINSGIFPDYPDQLYYVEVPVISNSECEDDYGSGQITAQMICAGNKVSTDSCQGDSGGPLWVDDNGYASQIGVVSWGIGCADGYPGVYARVTEFIDWIANQM